MTTRTIEPTEDPTSWGPLSLHIRRLRQWYGEDGLTQAELAELAGLSPRLLRSLEACRSLPHAVEALFAISIALRLPLESLIDPRQVERLRQAIEERRDRLAKSKRATSPDGSNRYAS
jgi:transcriptional regulator with XRE-family HTH domain